MGTASDTRAPILLERDDELAAIDALTTAAIAGHGRLAVVEGEPGVGKSQLLHVARVRAQTAGMRVLAARGAALETGLPFGVATQLLGSAPGGKGAAWLNPSPQADGLAVIKSLYEAIADLALPVHGDAGAGSMLLAVDDAQWADEPSLRFLAHLALRIDDLPAALVVAVRSGEPGSPDELLHQLREAAQAQVLTLRELSNDGVATVVRAALGDHVDATLIDACRRATGGNPFYLRELLAELAADGRAHRPDRIEDVAPQAVLRSVMVRLGRLGHEASALARATSILGDGVALRLAAALAGLDLPDAEVAADTLAAGRILEGGEPLRFRHPLIASALQSDMGSFERARNHRRAAELLLADASPPERVAAHLLTAYPQGDACAVAVLDEAAASALAGGAPAVAARLLRRALAEPPPADARAGLLLACAKAEALAGLPGAADRLEEALDAIELPDGRVDALTELATLAHHEGQFARAAELAARARDALPPTHPRREQLLGIELSAGTLDPELAQEAALALEPIRVAAREGAVPSDPRLRALVIGWMTAAGDPAAAVRKLIDAAIAVDPLIDDSHGMSLGWVGSAFGWWLDELEPAERWLDDAIATAERRGAVMAGATAALQRAVARYHRGRLDDSISDGERALEIHSYGWTTSPWSTPTLALAYTAMGELDAARETIDLGRRTGDARSDYGLILEAEARLWLADGDPAAALEAATAVGEHIEGRYGVHQPRVWEWRRLAATAAHRLGRDEDGYELIEPDLRALRVTGPRRQLGAALTAAGLVVGGTEGLDLLAEAAAVLSASPSRLQRAETFVEFGAALRRAGQRGAAKEQLYRGLELAADMGAVLLERRARDELRRLGLRPRRAARSGLASLTPSERQVAELAAQGLTTPQIASHLHVTRNTVETHLRHVYRKLDLSGRTQLPDALVETTAPT